ncbi:abnormal pharyngeal pumping eat-20 [Ditylenchus destructor]|uniref:Abnormal pharyngeal pumping eat-20 n=1 Tax=Ditylenchus destructor TaxID=166010 RepID=A0AAD4MRD1_9BILA|nr:abnormal pharyngeal pumping eat-20 [Ditylenchus destructor]
MRQKTNFKPISRPTSSCPFKCENGGKCVVKQIPTGGEIALCECTYGFLGANCNIQDMCADNKTCAAYGPEAKCLVDAVSLSNKITSTLIKSPYLCMCYNDNSEWVDCSELPPSELPPVPNAPRAQPPPNPSDGPPHGSGSFESSSDGDDELPSPVPSLRGPSTPETLPPELMPEPKGNSSDVLVPSGSTQMPQFPMHVHVTASPTSHDSSSSDSTSKETSPFNVPNAQSNHTMDPPPPFPITNMSQKLINYLNTLTTKVPSQIEFQNVTKDVTKTEPTTLPFDPQTTPLSTTVQTTSKQDIATPELRTTKPTLEINATNAPALTSKPTEMPAPFSFNTQPSPTSTSKESEKVVSGGEDDDEREGDNGFERVTQIASEISSETTTSPEEETTKAHTLRPQIWPNGEPTINRSEAIETHETDHFGARPPMGGFSPHEEHGGAFVSPSSGIGPDQEEHNHVEMEFPGKPADPFGPSSPMPIPPEHFSPDHMTEEHSHNNSVVHSGHEKGIQTSHTEKTDDQSKSGGNEFSSQKNGNNVRGGKGSEENKSLGVESNHVGSAEERVRVPDESKESSSFGNSTTWIIAIAVLSFLSLSAMTGAVCIARYIRRSRRLHGKYNPAREENAVSACTYSMPMTAISKEERLI